MNKKTTYLINGEEYIKKLILVYVLLLVGCGSDICKFDLYLVPEEFEAYVQNFTDLAKSNNRRINNKNLIIRFNDSLMKDNILGVCIYGGRTPIIEIDESEWYDMSPMRREQLLFHELGHCLLGRDHNIKTMLGIDNIDIPVSIMYPYLFNTWHYENNYQHYISELFNWNNILSTNEIKIIECYHD